MQTDFPKYAKIISTKMDQVYSNTRYQHKSTRVNTSQNESTRVGRDSKVSELSGADLAFPGGQSQKFIKC